MWDTIRKDSVLRRAGVVGLVLTLIVAVLYISPVYREAGKAVAWFYDLGTVFLAGLATVLMVVMWRTFERGETLWIVWGLLALGMFLWALGEAIWAYYELILDEDPFPSVADVVWTIGYIPLFISFLLRFLSLRTLPTRNQFLIAGGVFLLLLVLGVVFVIAPIITDDEPGDRTEQFLTVLYPIGDLAIAFVALLSVAVLSGGTLSYPWLVLAFGFLVTSVADLVFVYAEWKEVYLTGQDVGTNLDTALADVVYYAGYVVIAFAMVMWVRLRAAD